MTAAEYLVIEAATEWKYELLDGELLEMPPASHEHCAITTNLVGEFGIRLKDGPYYTLSSRQRVYVGATGSFVYPDVLFYRDRWECSAPDRDSITNPQVVIEVASAASVAYDRGRKFRQYRRLPSLQEYVLVCETRVRAERLVRRADGEWELTTFNDPAGELALATVPVSVPLADVYRHVDLPADPPLR